MINVVKINYNNKPQRRTQNCKQMTGLNLMTLLRPEDLEYITSKEILKNVKGSTIENYSVNNYNEIISTKRTEYATIMRDIWKTMTRDELLDRPKGQMIICDDSMKKDYFSSINTHHNLYFHGQDANGTMKEILYLCKKKNYTIKITIKKNDKVFSYKQ